MLRTEQFVSLLKRVGVEAKTFEPSGGAPCVAIFIDPIVAANQAVQKGMGMRNLASLIGALVDYRPGHAEGKPLFFFPYMKVRKVVAEVPEGTE